MRNPYRAQILRWVELEPSVAPVRRRRPSGWRAPGALGVAVAVQVAAAAGGIVLIRPGGPLPSPVAAAAPGVPAETTVAGAPASGTPGSVARVEAVPVPVGTSPVPPVASAPWRGRALVPLGPPAETDGDGSRPSTYRGRAVHYDRWAFWGPRIRGCESGAGPLDPGDYDAENPVSTASGAYQVTDGSWGGAFGVRSARLAPPAEQEQQAYALFLRRGTQPWTSSQACWELS